MLYPAWRAALNTASRVCIRPDLPNSTESGGPPVRTTRDVDVIVEVVSLGQYHAPERQLEHAGLSHDRSPDAPVCRWLAGTTLLDVMPTDKAVLGFGNRWYEEAVRGFPIHPSERNGHPTDHRPVFMATKLEAFADRGEGELLAFTGGRARGSRLDANRGPSLASSGSQSLVARGAPLPPWESTPAQPGGTSRQNQMRSRRRRSRRAR